LVARPPTRWVDDLGAAIAGLPTGRGLRARLERALVAAGMDGAYATRWLGAQALAVAAAGAALAIGILVGAPPALLAIAALPGAAIPCVNLGDRRRRRLDAIGRALPWSLDLLCLAMEVGVDFNGALARVVEKARPGPWTDELARTLRAMRLG